MIEENTLDSRLSASKWQSNNTLIFFAVAIVAFFLRLCISRAGHNYDFESFELVADLVGKGENVYAATVRYNYSPAWMWILFVIKLLSGAHFRWALSAFVSMVDIAIATLLWKRGNTKVAYLLLLSPVSIIISGYHNQFDNAAILVGLLAIPYAETRPDYKAKGMTGLALKEVCVTALLIGLAITMKHILFFFPLWFLFRRDLSISAKFLLMGIPYAVFFASFLPYISAIAAIRQNVFAYAPHLNAPLYHLLVPEKLIDYLNMHSPSVYRYLFYAFVISGGIWYRNLKPREAILFYYAFVVLFSCSLYTHYLVIPMLFLASGRIIYWCLYNAFGLLFFIFHHDQLNLVSHVTPRWQAMADYIEMNGYYPLMVILSLAVLSATWSGIKGNEPIQAE